jgi:Ala-tRNA(Pro) deacylase
MPIATTVGDALAFEGVDFDLLRHAETHSAAETARAAGITPEKLAKAVLLKDSNGYLLAVLPATRVLDIGVLQQELHRPLEIADEYDLDGLFCDCAVGAVPPIGPWYRVPTVVDPDLRRQSDIYFEAGDHHCLVHVTEPGFERLLGGVEFFAFSRQI